MEKGPEAQTKKRPLDVLGGIALMGFDLVVKLIDPKHEVRKIF